jgi:hypothetical protein
MLKPNRIEDPYGQRITGYYPDPSPNSTSNYGTIAERGGVASQTGSGPTSGDPGDTGCQIAYASDPTVAVPFGLLLYDVIKYDTNRQHENFYKSGFQARVGMKVAVDKRGEYQTNMIPSGVTNISWGQPAYLAASGLISNVQASSVVNSITYLAPQIGTWQSTIDSDGYAKLDVLIK